MPRPLAARLVLAGLLVGGILVRAAAGLAADARAAVEAFVARLADVQVSDLTVDQAITLYAPDGRLPQSRGEQRVIIKLPRRQRIEQTIEGQREVRLLIGDRVWVRRADGKIYEVPAVDRDRDRSHLLVPFRRSAADLLAEWRSLGVRDDVSHVTQVAGRRTVVIGAPAGDRQSAAIWLDEEYGVVRVITRERLPQGPGLIDIAYSEHRPLVGGFFFPYRQEVFVDGRLLLLVTVRSVAVNTNPSDDLFDPQALPREQ